MAEIRAVSHSYPMPDGSRKEVLSDISLQLQPGGFYAILGRSGCGKSTLLRLMAGLERPEQGQIRLPEGGIGVVFQEARLMPWATVEENVAFLLKGRLPQAQIRDRCTRLLKAVGLWDMRDNWPSQLSGGMAQRVAIARALAQEPALLLMDEPFGALDAFTRKQMQEELVQIWQATGTTIVFVTHDIEEAVRLGQRILVIEEGRFALQCDLDARYPRSGAEPAVNAIRQRLLDQLFARPCASFLAGSLKVSL